MTRRELSQLAEAIRHINMEAGVTRATIAEAIGNAALNGRRGERAAWVGWLKDCGFNLMEAEGILGRGSLTPAGVKVR
jgi:hypothetical protein